MKNQLNPNNKTIKLVNKLIKLFEQKKFKSIIDDFKKNNKILINNADALNILGASMAALGDIEGALKRYKKVLEIDENHSDTLNNLGIIFYEMGEYEKSINLYKKVDKTGSFYSNTLNNMGNSYRALKMYEDALNCFSESIKFSPRNIDYSRNKILTLIEMGKYEIALNEIIKLSDFDDDKVFIYEKKFECALGLEKYKNAIENLKQLEIFGEKNHITKNNLGFCYLKNEELEIACELFKESLTYKKDFPNANFNLGLCLFQIGAFKEALKYFELTIKFNRSFNQAYAFIAKSKFELFGVEKAYSDFLNLQIYDEETFDFLAIKLHEEGFFDYEIHILKEIITHKPDNELTFIRLGNAQVSYGQTLQAIESYNNAIFCNKNSGLSYFNLGASYASLSRFDEAIKAYEKSIEILPNYLDARNNLALCFSNTGKLEAAINMFLSIINIDKNYHSAHVNCGNAFLKRGNLDRAISAFQSAIRIRPDDPSNYNNLGNALKAKGEILKAINAYSKAVHIDSEHPEAIYNLCYQLSNVSDWEELDKHRATLELVGEIKGAFSPFGFWQFIDDPERLLVRAERYSRKKYFQEELALGFEYTQEKKIKLGFFSSDFRTHPVTFLLIKTLELLDRNTFEVSAYSFEPDKGDKLRKKVEITVDNFYDISSFTDEEVVSFSRKNKIDIAIDLTGYTDKDRCIPFAQRVAPVQVNFLGYPGTTGSSFFDFILADQHVIPKEERRFYSESVIYMPDTYMPTDNSRPIYKGIQTRAMHNLPDDAFVICCFNNNYKITSSEFSVWAEVLEEIPNSILWLRKSNDNSKRNLLSHAEKLGITSDRIVFAEMIDIDQHLARHKLADIFVDTFKFNAHTTATEALYAGLPVITKTGRSFGARVCTSLLHAIGLPELVTTTKREYKERIIYYAENPKALRELKMKLEANLTSKPLFDSHKYAENLKIAFVSLYEKIFRDGKKSDIFLS